jgi:hypothetical protein
MKTINIIGYILMLVGIAGWFIAGPQGIYIPWVLLACIGVYFAGRSIPKPLNSNGLTIKEFVLEDVNLFDPKKSIDCSVEIGADTILFKVKGYGDHCSQDGRGSIVMIENYNGKPVLYVWDDINEQEPKRISLEKAKESNRV